METFLNKTILEICADFSRPKFVAVSFNFGECNENFQARSREFNRSTPQVCSQLQPRQWLTNFDFLNFQTALNAFELRMLENLINVTISFPHFPISLRFHFYFISEIIKTHFVYTQLFRHLSTKGVGSSAWSLQIFETSKRATKIINFKEFYRVCK